MHTLLTFKTYSTHKGPSYRGKRHFINWENRLLFSCQYDLNSMCPSLYSCVSWRETKHGAHGFAEVNTEYIRQAQVMNIFQDLNKIIYRLLIGMKS